MADDKTKDSGSAEAVAFKLLMEIASIERGFPERKKLLDTYAECLDATRGARDYTRQK